MSIAGELWWTREIVPDSLGALVAQLCTHFGVPASSGGIKGNTAHRRGRHRSVEWALKSSYCTDRSYGTRDPRDRRGNPRHLRAFDLSLSPTQLVAVCRRVDAAVRAGRLPQLAEWFGTLDGRTVTGWFEGHRSSADDSHLWHIHGGFWTENADDDHSELFRVMTGEDDDVSWTEEFPITKSIGSRFGSDPMDARECLQQAAIHSYDSAKNTAAIRLEVAKLIAGQRTLVETINRMAGGQALDPTLVLVELRAGAYAAVRDVAGQALADELIKAAQAIDPTP